MFYTMFSVLLFDCFISQERSEKRVKLSKGKRKINFGIILFHSHLSGFGLHTKNLIVRFIIFGFAYLFLDKINGSLT